MDVEITTGLHRFEVRTQASVIPTSERDVLAVEDARIAPLSYINF